MPLLINRKEVEPLLSAGEAVRVMEEAFREYDMNPSINHPRRRLHVYHEEGRQVRLSLFLGVLPLKGHIGAFLRTDHFKTERHASKHLPTNVNHGFYLLYSAEDAYPLALFYGGANRSSTIRDLVQSATCLRTAAISTLGTKYMARRDAKTLGFIGSGYQAPSHLAAICAVTQFKMIKNYSLTPEHRERFAKEMRVILNQDIVPVTNSMDVVKGSDIVMCVTDSRVPVFDGDLLKEGMHVTCIVAGHKDEVGGGRREVDDRALRKCHAIGTTSKEQAEEDGQLTLWEPSRRGVIKWESVLELKDLVAGKIQARTQEDQITLFHNSAGQGIADLAIHSLLYELAKKNGIGTELDMN